MRLRPRAVKPGYAFAWTAQMRRLVSLATPFVLVAEHKANETADDARLRGTWMRMHRAMLVSYCRGLILIEPRIEARASTRESLRAMTEGSGVRTVVASSIRVAGELAPVLLKHTASESRGRGRGAHAGVLKQRNDQGAPCLARARMGALLCRPESALWGLASVPCYAGASQRRFAEDAHADLPRSVSTVDRRARGVLAEEARRIRWNAVLAGPRCGASRRSRGGSSAARPICAITRWTGIWPSRAQQDALVYVSTETGIERRYTYAELHAEVNRMAAVMRSLHVKKGDRVLIYLPMIPEALFAMLAYARIGRSIRSCSAASRRRSSRRGSTTPSPR